MKPRRAKPVHVRPHREHVAAYIAGDVVFMGDANIANGLSSGGRPAGGAGGVLGSPAGAAVGGGEGRGPPAGALAAGETLVRCATLRPPETRGPMRLRRVAATLSMWSGIEW